MIKKIVLLALFSHSVLADVYCSHSEICRLIDLVSNQQMKTVTLVNVKGDPHEFEPTSDEIKTLLARSPLYVGPIELHPWMSKILEKRKQNHSLITIAMNDIASFKKIYPTSTNEILAHFWLYPEIYCAYKKEMTEALKFNKSDCNSQLILSELKKKIGPIKIPIVFTHDALVPLFLRFSSNNGQNFIPLKSSGHHDEVSPLSVKKINQALRSHPQVLWIVEENIDVPQNVLNLIRKNDLLLKINTSNSKNSTSDFEILNSIVKNL